MATYIPNATQTTEPVESRTVESAALEFRTLKTSVNARIEAVQDDINTEIANRIAGDANLQAQNNAQDVRLTAIENALPFIGEGGLPGTVYVQRLSGTGAQTVFTLNAAPQSNNVVDIYINGLYQNKDTFTVSGADVIFSKAPPAGTNNIEVQVTVTIALGETDASLVTYDATTVEAQLDAISAAGGSSLVGFQQADAGAVVRTAQDKMREVVSVKDFGAVGDGVTDDRPAIEAAINYASSIGGAELYYPDGTYLINSYSSDTAFVSAHGQILPIKSRVSHRGSGAATIKVGPFFDDKPFVLFSGFNAVNVALFTDIHDVRFFGLTFEFSADVSRMRTGYKRRLAIEFGKIYNGAVLACKFKNGDLSNCIGAGFGGAGDVVLVADNFFIDLVAENPVNIDHTTCYMGARNSLVVNNIFKGYTTQIRKVACAVEMHNSNSSASHNNIENYTRGVWFVSQATEAQYVANLSAIGNTALVTNAFAYLWADNGCALDEILIADNCVICVHISGESQLYNGFQGIVSSSNPTATGDSAKVVVRGNVVRLGLTVTPGTATAAYFERPFSGVTLASNMFYDANDGVKFTDASKSIYSFNLIDNVFESNAQSENFIDLTCATANNVVISRNIFKFNGPAKTTTIRFNPSVIAGNCTIEQNRHTWVMPSSTSVSFSSAALPGTNCGYEFSVYNATVDFPPLAANATGLATINGVPSSYVTFGTTFEWKSYGAPNELALANVGSAVSSGSMKLICVNKTGVSYPGVSGNPGELLLRLYI